MGCLYLENIKRHRFFAFTLVELLVVIAIIALLLAILMPSLQRAKDNSQRVVCASNLKQLGMGWGLYANDNKNTFPVGGSYSSVNPDMPYWYHCGIGIGNYMPTPTLDERDPTKPLPTKESVSRVWYCPSHAGDAIKESSPSKSRPAPYRSVKYPPVGYAYNYHIGYLPKIKQCLKVGNIKMASAVPLLVEFWLTRDIQKQTEWSSYTRWYCVGNLWVTPYFDEAGASMSYCFAEGISLSHKGATNFLCADTHVQTVGKKAGVIYPVQRSVNQAQWENNLNLYKTLFKWHPE